MAGLAEPGPSPARRGASALATVARVAQAAVAGTVLLPALALAGSPIHASPPVIAISLLITAVTAATTWRWAGQSRISASAGFAAFGLGAWLLGEASYPGSGLVVSALVGAGLGPLLPRIEGWSPLRDGSAIVAATGGLAGVRVFFDAGTTSWVSGGLALAALAGTLLEWPAAVFPQGASSRTALASLALYACFSVCWVGSTSPSVEWFGALSSHGPRSGYLVALTFDDGPDGPYTDQMAAILEKFGVRGTFFELGKALRREPDVARHLVEAGHVVGNHSYSHGAFSYLDPRYPELDQTQQAFRETLGICPALFRPPHGTHTPFMSWLVGDADMTLVTWDVSAKDWAERDPDRLARNILAKVRPGSIILLHDGLDGAAGADRSVVVQALPKIIQGLQDRGLEPVTLDRLLGVEPYLADCH